MKLPASSRILTLLSAGFLFFVGACSERAQLGTEKNPVKFFFIPSVDSEKLAARGHLVEKFLHENTPFKYKISVPTSYVAVIEAFGTSRADVATLNTFGYLLAHERYGVEAGLLAVRFGSETYRGQIVARADSGINKVEDLAGKKIAYVDPSSTSGFLLPAKLLKDKNIAVKDSVFAQSHGAAITMVYRKQVDAAATFYTPPEADGKLTDARRLVVTQFPDVGSVIKIIGLTDDIPNDPIAFRKGLPEDIRTATTDALLKYMKTDEGKEVFKELYMMTDLIPTTDKKYDAVRDVLAALGKSAGDLLK
jgi:phosphonate transport system substrate-binding protein